MVSCSGLLVRLFHPLLSSCPSDLIPVCLHNFFGSLSKSAGCKYSAAGICLDEVHLAEVRCSSVRKPATCWNRHIYHLAAYKCSQSPANCPHFPPLSTKSASDLTDADFVSLLSVLPVICHLSGQMQILFSPHWQDTGKTFRSLLVWQ